MRRLPPRVTDALAAIEEAEAADPIDLALARLLAGLDLEHARRDGRPEDPERARAVALTGALVSRARRDGHAAIALDEHAGRPFPEDEHARSAFRGLPRLPEVSDWRRFLEASPVVGDASSPAPLVIEPRPTTEGGDRLAFRRFVDAEHRVAASVSARLGAEAEGPRDSARDAFPTLFVPREDRALDRQALAAAAALHQRMLLVAGGPGTGKTYTAARLLALVLADQSGTRIALAAPTGKAAQRLSESIQGALASLPENLAEGVPTEAVTLHRLLGAHPEREGFRHDARRPLPHDLVLVDEGSMIDLPLFDALLAALRPEARLVVLGDPDQLAPVEAGTPFADLCAAGEGGATPDLAAFCASLGLPGVEPGPGATALSASVIRLTESRRFGPDSDVGALAEAIRQSDGDAALAVLSDAAHGGVTLTEDVRGAIAWALPFAREVVTAGIAVEALEALERFRLLAAVRRGPRGVEGLNAAIESALREAGLVWWPPYDEPFYRGRPVLVTVNDPETRLANGDVGVQWTTEAGRVAVFPGPDGPREIALARMPAHEPAWALTIHKSQGSEFAHVGAVMPEPGTRGATLLTRELLYTATTRAKETVALFGARGQVQEAVETRQRRLGGLADRLGKVLR
ncbi:MAG: exodeoxyribonuclease V subunit alpha [Bacteroidota bacterium]